MLDEIHSRLPMDVFVQFDTPAFQRAQRKDDTFIAQSASVTLTMCDDAMKVQLHCPDDAIGRIVLRWPTPRWAPGSLFMGDHWERSYGDLQWQPLHPHRVMPWYVLAHDPHTDITTGTGVCVQPAAMCFWMIDDHGVSLWLDVRNGGMPSLPGDRQIELATIVGLRSESDKSPFALATQLCKHMCPKPRLPKMPVVGNNNWYYAYGVNFNADTMRRDAAFLSELAGDHPNRPYCVIDAGWTPRGTCPGGPWDKGVEGLFPDMAQLATDMLDMGVKPGIWIRPTALSVVTDPGLLRDGPHRANEKPLDITRAENLHQIHTDVARLRQWGYELIKHDFSAYDHFGRWGFAYGAELTEDNWHFADRTLTNAEIILQLYRTLRDATGDGILLGCNTFGHLGAGLFEVQRTGDDTSGRNWERTRRMGVNTLAYRLCQHNTFFSVDADCAPHTPQTPWALDRQWIDLVARSGTSLFISVDPSGVDAQQKAFLSESIRLSLDGGVTPAAPLDWLHTTAPEQWQLGNATQTYNWSEPFGTSPLMRG